MNTGKIKRVLIISALLCAPVLSHAANAAVAVTDNTALFTIDFDFVTASEPYRVPIGAVDRATVADFVQYVVTPEVDVSNAIVLSDQPTDGIFYHVPASSQASFTLVILATVPENLTNAQYSAHLQDVPYYRGDELRTVSDDRLERFASPSVLLNRTIEASVFQITTK